MKCPSCGVWNRAHFTKCFQCGADLTAEAENQAAAEESALPKEKDLPSSFPEGNFSLYDAGNWVEEDEDDTPYVGKTEKAAPIPASDEQPALPINEEEENEGAQEQPDSFFPENDPFEVEETEAPAARRFSLAALLGLDEASKSAKKARQAQKKNKGKHIPEDDPEEYDLPVQDQDEAFAPAYESPKPEAPAIHEAMDEDEVVTVALNRKEETVASDATGIFPGVNAPDSPVAEETRKFNLNDLPAADELTEGTRKFSLSSLQKEDLPKATPIAADDADEINEPEVAPTAPGISHEIINAIFTNPQANSLPSEVFAAEDVRPRKLMSLSRFDIEEPEEDEPETQFVDTPVLKEEPIVEDVKSYKPTARISAQKADEAGDEFTAFANAKRSLIAEIGDNDPFNSAIQLPKEEKPEPKAEQKPEKKAEEPENTKTEEAEEVVPVTVEPAARLSKDIEVPLWAKQAMVSLGEDDISLGHDEPAEANPRRKRRTVFGIQEDLTEGLGSSTRMELPLVEEPRPAPAPRSGLDSIARHDAVRKRSVLTGRTFGVIEDESPNSIDFAAAQPVRPVAAKAAPVVPPHAAAPVVAPRTAAPSRPAPRQELSARPLQRKPQNPQSIPQQRASVQHEMPREQRNDPRQQQPVRRAPQQQQQRPQQAPAKPRQINPERTEQSNTPARPAPQLASRPAMVRKDAKVQNLPRLILLGAAALLIVVLVFWGLIAGIKAIVKKAADKPADTDISATEQSEPVQDENAPVITTGERNGHPTHVFTFKGNDNDIIYVSGDNLPNSYNVPIVSGIGTLEIDDSELIGNRYANEDIEVTLNSVLHEASSGKETQLSPVTFTVTPPVAYLVIVTPEGSTAETTLSTFQVKVRVEIGSVVTIDGSDVSDMITEESSDLGSIVFNVSVDPIGANEIPVTVMKEGCKSVTETITIVRPEMTVPIELDPSTPSASSTDNLVISGSVAPGVTVTVNTPTLGNVTLNEDGTFSFTAQLSFGPNDIVITASNGTDSSDLTHTVTYTPSYNDYVALAYKMNYNDLTAFAGKYQPFKCTGYVIEAYTSDPYTCLFNVSTEEDPKYIYLEMVEGKPLSEDHRYTVYADVHADGTHEEYPYLIGRYFIEDDE